MKKKIFLLLLLFTLFFGLKTSVHALECYYRLPFIGLDASGNTVSASNVGCSKFTCTYDALIQSHGDITRDATFFQYDRTETTTVNACFGIPPICKYEHMYFNAYIPSVYRTWEDQYQDFGSTTWYRVFASNATLTSGGLFAATNDNPSGEDEVETMFKNSFIQGDECPRYITILPDSRKSGVDNVLSSGGITFSKFDDYIKGNHIQDCDSEDSFHVQIKPGKDDTNDTYVSSTSGYVYKLYTYGDGSTDEMIRRIKENSTSSDGYITLPLVDFNNGDTEKNSNKATENLNEMVKYAGDAWFSKLKSYDDQLKTACASLPHTWNEYINLSNYRNSVGNRDDFRDYLSKSFGSVTLDSYDAGMTESCWNVRSQMASDFYNAGAYFALSIGLERNADTTDYNASNKTGNQYVIPFGTGDYTKNFDETSAKKFKTIEWHYNSFVTGVETTLDEFVSGVKEIEELDQNYEEARKKCEIAELVSKDRCSYHCKNPNTNKFDKQYYEYCKANNEVYKTCYKKYYEECNCSSCEHIPDSSAQASCYSTCQTCAGGGTDIFSLDLYNNFNSKASQECRDAEDAVKGIINDNRKTYKYEVADPMNVKWRSTTYEGKCEDFQYLRWVWVAINIAAPFLVIVLGSFDYFKNILSAGNEDQMNKNRKNFRRRLIALIILILTPFIIKTIVSNFTPSDSGASNFKIMRCIINGE